MSALVSNLLDMARIESGGVKLNLEWQSLEEVVGTALDATRGILKQHRVEVRLPPGLPLVRFDALLIERVLVNLLENAAKYTAPGSTVAVSAEVVADQLRVSSRTMVPGLPIGREDAVFEKFTRGQSRIGHAGGGLRARDLPCHHRIARRKNPWPQ